MIITNEQMDQINELRPVIYKMLHGPEADIDAVLRSKPEPVKRKKRSKAADKPQSPPGFFCIMPGEEGDPGRPEITMRYPGATISGCRLWMGPDDECARLLAPGSGNPQDGDRTRPFVDANGQPIEDPTEGYLRAEKVLRERVLSARAERARLAMAGDSEAA